MAETMFASTIKQMKGFLHKQNAPTKALLPFPGNKTLLPVRVHLWYRRFFVWTSASFKLWPPRTSNFLRKSSSFWRPAPSRSHAVPISRAISAVASPAPAQMSKTQSSKMLRRHVLRGASSRLGPEVKAIQTDIPKHLQAPSPLKDFSNVWGVQTLNWYLDVIGHRKNIWTPPGYIISGKNNK